MMERENLNARVRFLPSRVFSARSRWRNRLGRAGSAALTVFSVLAASVAFGAASAIESNAPVPLRFAPQDDSVLLAPFLPPKSDLTGCAVLIVPGSAADVGRETQLAKWLNTQGIAAFILRRSPTAVDQNLTAADLAQALRYLREHAAALGLSSRHVGLLGFGHGAELAAAALAAPHDLGPAGSSAPETVDHTLTRPAFLALIGGASLPTVGKGEWPPTFLVGSARSSDGMSSMIELWGRLRTARVPVDAHFFARADVASGLAADQASLGPWPEMLHAWLRASGFLTEAPRLALKGMVYLDGQPLAQGYVIFTPVDTASSGTGPVIGRVLNSTAGVPIGEFSLPAAQGPVAGRYRVDVRQNMTRWLSNSFSGDLVNARGAPTPAQAYFGHHRQLEPSIDDQHSYVRVHPTDREEATIEFQPGAQDNLQLKIEVFSR